jgi:HSP20 family molecular chaperone IbpA
MNHVNKKKGNRFNPPVSITEDNSHITITIGLHGVTEEQVRIELEKTILTVMVSADGKLLRKVIQVPEGVRFFKKRFSDGILEVFLQKPAC